jgi:hypothetical protein
VMIRLPFAANLFTATETIEHVVSKELRPC